MHRWLRRLHDDTRGFTAVEMIVAVAVGGLVMAAIFPIFLLLNRAESTWSANEQARAIGLVAEQSLSRDIREYHIVQHGHYNIDEPGDCAACRCELILQGVPSKPSLSESTFWIRYSIESNAPSGDATLPILIRTVSYSKAAAGKPQSRSTVAHGVHSFTTSEVGNGAQVEVQMTLTGTGGRQVRLVPALRITPLVASADPRGCL